MLFAIPSAIFAVPGVNEHISETSLKAGRATCSNERAHADHLLVPAAACPNCAVRDHGVRLIKRRCGSLEDITIHYRSAGHARVDHHDFSLQQNIVPRGETRLDGANNKNVSLFAQGLTPRNRPDCVSSTSRSWSPGHDLRSVYPAKSPRHRRSQSAARPASTDVRPSRNDLLAQ